MISNHIKLSEISVSKLRNNKFEDSIPEFYELRDVIENNDTHDNDSVFDHTLAVLENLEKLMKNLKDENRDYLNQKIMNHTRKEILFLATIFHDIGKKETLKEDDGKTSCLGHEEIGSKKVVEILDRLELAEEEKNFVIKIIKNHGIIYDIVNSKNYKLNEEFEKYKSDYSDIFLEMMLLFMADSLGSQLGKFRPDELNFRITFFNKVLEE